VNDEAAGADLEDHQVSDLVPRHSIRDCQITGVQQWFHALAIHHRVGHWPTDARWREQEPPGAQADNYRHASACASHGLSFVSCSSPILDDY
jgi:hypothetical protein